MAKLLQYTVIGVASVVQASVLAAYTGPQDWAKEIWAYLESARYKVVDAVNATEVLSTEVPQAGTTVWLRIPRGPDEDAMSRLLGREYGIPAVQGRLFGSNEPRLRIPFAGSLSATPELLDRFARLAKDAATGPVPY
jgi:aspartate/methionine/tyrosine aminotransferase